MYLYGTDLSAEKASWKHQMWDLKCSSLVHWYKDKNTRAIWLLLTGSAKLSSGEHSNAGERIVSVFRSSPRLPAFSRSRWPAYVTHPSVPRQPGIIRPRRHPASDDTNKDTHVTPTPFPNSQNGQGRDCRGKGPSGYALLSLPLPHILAHFFLRIPLFRRVRVRLSRRRVAPRPPRRPQGHCPSHHPPLPHLQAFKHCVFPQAHHKNRRKCHLGGDNLCPSHRPSSRSHPRGRGKGRRPGE